ncbi:RDD family protein [Myroides sp. M-43]|uniref:RDD family protein n=1 Tax=Myroides oncorhynchi TaxID=2893756 RepID=UPI001E369AB6|nr:RDD family protein [Myroides oncorhynchi]MCC9043229.1 RDD family protein [Myroides oncorhynchi]
MANLTINTTQNIKIEFIPASVGERMVASILDVVFKLLYVFLVAYVVAEFEITNKVSDDWSKAAIVITVLLPIFFYSLFFEAILQGATPGKKIMRIKVIKIDGYQATIVDYATRWVMRLIDFWIGSAVIGLVSVVCSNKGQRLGDILAGTSVISTKERVFLSATIFQEIEEHYVPLFSQVLSLNDKDIYIIKEALIRIKASRDIQLLYKLVDKLKDVLAIVDTKAESEIEFVETILKDYNYLTAKS